MNLKNLGVFFLVSRFVDRQRMFSSFQTNEVFLITSGMRLCYQILFGILALVLVIEWIVQRKQSNGFVVLTATTKKIALYFLLDLFVFGMLAHFALYNFCDFWDINTDFLHGITSSKWDSYLQWKILAIMAGLVAPVLLFFERHSKRATLSLFSALLLLFANPILSWSSLYATMWANGGCLHSD